MANIEFKETSLVGGWQVEVWAGRDRHLGNIRQNSAGDGYSYFPGPHNELNASLSDLELEPLKQKIESAELARSS
jgi:hypothetical protein